MTVVFLLALIVLILLFGAAAVKGFIRGILLYSVIGFLLVACYVALVNLVGRDKTYLVHMGGIISLLVLWAFGKWASTLKAQPFWQKNAERNRRERIAAGDNDTIGSALRRWEREKEAVRELQEDLAFQPESDVGSSVNRLSKEQRKKLRNQYRLEKPNNEQLK